MFQHLLKDEYQLEDYQLKGIKYALKHHYSVNASGLGTGKTLMGLTTAYFHQSKIDKFPVLLVVPSCVRYNWEREIHRTSAVPKKVVQLRDAHVEDCDFAICTYDYLRVKYKALKGKFRMAIFDEAHALKNITTKITLVAHEFLEKEQFDLAVFLTGTPIKNRVSEIYSLLCLCAYNPRMTSGVDVIDEYSYYEFCNRFCFVSVKRLRSGRRIKEFYGLKNKPLLNTLLKDKFFRVESDVLGLDKPILNYVEVKFKKDTELVAAWENFNRGKGKNSTVKKEAALFQAKYTKDYTNELINSGHSPVVIFTDHVDSAELISKGVKGQCRFIHGKVSDSDRASAVDLFQKGELDAIVLTYGTSSTGINLQNSNQMVLNDLPWVPEDLTQALARTRRKGQKKQCFYHIVTGGKMTKYIQENILNPKKKTLEAFYEK